jgi:hypothetical protein
MKSDSSLLCLLGLPSGSCSGFNQPILLHLLIAFLVSCLFSTAKHDGLNDHVWNQAYKRIYSYCLNLETISFFRNRNKNKEQLMIYFEVNAIFVPTENYLVINHSCASVLRAVSVAQRRFAT